jgi:sterol desaturase/sphingolipid hydroxylase (fatty acid hydroxylase superfamily)
LPFFYTLINQVSIFLQGMSNFTTEELLVLISTPIYVFIILLEIFLSNFHKRELYTQKDTITNLVFMLVNMGVDLAFRFVYLFILSYCFQFSFVSIHQPILYWGLLVIAEDFVFYWLHRMEHYVRFFWAVHVTHHSSEQFNFTVGFRSSVFQPIYRFVFFIPLVLFGFKPEDILVVFAATQIWGILVHTKLINKMGILEHILITPSHHRVHHASNIKYLDKNMGMFLVVWDKLFGTFQKELSYNEYQPIKYGLTANIEKPTPIKLLFQEWTAIFNDVKKPISFTNKLKYMFMPPGWSHDKSTLTSKELRHLEKQDQ